MVLYPYRSEDVSPDACRSTCFTGILGISVTPCQTNMSHQECTSGWCGTSNDNSLTALGEFDTDDADWLDNLMDTLPDRCQSAGNRAAITDWVAGVENGTGKLDYDDQPEDLTLDYDDSRGSKSATWNPSGEDDWFPALRNGWELIAGDDDCDSYLGDLGSIAFDDRLKTLKRAIGGSCAEIAEKLLDAAGISYDDICCEVHNSGGVASWRYLNCRNADVQLATAVIRRAAEIAAAWDNANIDGGTDELCAAVSKFAVRANMSASSCQPRNA